MFHVLAKRRRCVPILKSFLLVLSFIEFSHATQASNTLRYRGDYTLGHEVNTFCPENNSQCYWLAPESSPEAITQLKRLVSEYNTKPYQAVCVVLEGSVNREIESQGFAANYDGVILVKQVYDECSKNKLITQYDLQHHRWVLESINHQPYTTQFKQAPTLDFGEQMFVEVFDGCRKFTARAKFEGAHLVFDQVSLEQTALEKETCNHDEEQIPFSENPWQVNIPKQGILQLRSNNWVLDFKLNDWR